MRIAYPLAVSLALLSCNGDPKPSAEADPQPIAPAGRAAPRKKDKPVGPPLVPVVQMEELGDRPGYIPGGLVYGSIVVGEAQRFWDSLPQPEDFARDGVDVAAEIGFNPFAGNWAKQFHLADDAVISATILRPLDDDIGRLRTGLAGMGSSAGSTLDDATKLIAGGLGYHSRIHIPSQDPAKTRQALMAVFPSRLRSQGSRVCAALKGADKAGCAADGSGTLVVARQAPRAVVVDLFILAVGGYSLAGWGLAALSDAPSRFGSVREAVSAALTTKTAAIEHVGRLAGDAAVWIDPSALGRVAAIERIGSIVADAAFSEQLKPRPELERLTALEGLLASTRMFPGVGVSFDYVKDELHAVADWPVAGTLWGRMAVRSVVSRAATAGVPTVDALCKDSVVCFRTQGIPDTRVVAKRLLDGGFAASLDEVMRVVERESEYATVLLLAGAWPNLLAALQNAPESLSGTREGVGRIVRDAVLRAEGSGGVLRTYRIEGFFEFRGDYAVYARAAKTDIEAGAGLLALSGEPARSVELPQDQGSAKAIEMGRDPKSYAYLKVGEEAFGWAALASSPESFATLLTLDREVPTGPMAYVELPTLWRIAAPWGELELKFFRRWAQTHRLRIALELDAGAPRIRASLGPAQGGG